MSGRFLALPCLGGLLFRIAAGLEIHPGRRRMPVSWRDYITVALEVSQGKASIAGVCVLVTVVLDNLAAGRTPAKS